jgi:hypothetical protein
VAETQLVIQITQNIINNTNQRLYDGEIQISACSVGNMLRHGCVSKCTEQFICNSEHHRERCGG